MDLIAMSNARDAQHLRRSVVENAQRDKRQKIEAVEKQLDHLREQHQEIFAGIDLIETNVMQLVKEIEFLKEKVTAPNYHTVPYLLLLTHPR